MAARPRPIRKALKTDCTILASFLRWRTSFAALEQTGDQKQREDRDTEAEIG